MACDKPYGLRKVWIAEETDNSAGTFYGIKVQSIELPKIFTETADIDESSGFRGASNFVNGNINELTGTLVISFPATLSSATSGGIGALFRAAGMTVAADSSIIPMNNGACGNTLTIYTIDRTGMLAERLSGCIVTSFEFTCNRSDAPTISFSFTAAKKEEFWGSNAETITASASTITLTGGSFNNGLDKAVSLSSGYMPVKIGDEETGYISAVSSAGAITVTRSTPSVSGTVKVMPAAPAGAVAASNATPLSNRAWSLLEGSSAFVGKLQSLTLSVETGMSYGELIVGNDYVSEVLVGSLNITGSLTVYVDLTAGSMGNGYNLNSNHGFAVQVGDYFINLPGTKFTECPDLSLAKDEPCSGDFAFKCYNSGTGLDCFGIDDSNWSDI